MTSTTTAATSMSPADNYTHRRLYIDQDSGIIVADTAKFERWLQAVARPNSTPTGQDPTA